MNHIRRRHTLPFRIAALFALLIIACFAAEPRKPNIIFILSDDLAMGDVGAYGQKLIKTPHLDQLGREGTRYCRRTRARASARQLARR